MTLPPLTPKQRASFIAHLWKALTQQHHKEMLPLLRDWIPADGVVFDIGAHSGQFAKLFARLAPRGRIYAFEPAGYARAILERVVRYRGLRNVEAVPLALSDAPGEAEIATPIKPSGSYGFGLAHLGGGETGARVYRETVRAVPLDDFAAERGIARLDFIKLDVEGWEGHVLAGGRETLARRRPVIMVEVVASHLGRADSAPADLWDLLTPLGYRAHRMAPGRALAPASGYEGDTDYVFLPDETGTGGRARSG